MTYAKTDALKWAVCTGILILIDVKIVHFGRSIANPITNALTNAPAYMNLTTDILVIVRTFIRSSMKAQSLIRVKNYKNI